MKVSPNSMTAVLCVSLCLQKVASSPELSEFAITLLRPQNGSCVRLFFSLTPFIFLFVDLSLSLSCFPLYFPLFLFLAVCLSVAFPPTRERRKTFDGRVTERIRGKKEKEMEKGIDVGREERESVNKSRRSNDYLTCGSLL